MKKCDDEEKKVEQLLKEEKANNSTSKKTLNGYLELLNNQLILENQPDSYYIALFQLLKNLTLEGS
jgi:hypothetical protein